MKTPQFKKIKPLSKREQAVAARFGLDVPEPIVFPPGTVIDVMIVEEYHRFVRLGNGSLYEPATQQTVWREGDPDLHFDEVIVTPLLTAPNA